MAAKVIESGAVQRQRDRFTIDACAASLPLAGMLLASGTPLHAQAALVLLDAILGRWGSYMHDLLGWVAGVQGWGAGWRLVGSSRALQLPLRCRLLPLH